MSSELVITCKGIGKAYQLYRHRNDQLKQILFGRWKRFYQQHWVLRDISFDVRKGECLGIIGRNGAGKTTLLQTICGITTPTYGEVSVTGRIAPILALGAGFDQELTGGENALIGGAILGLKRAEIAAQLASIEAFTDIGEFFHQPMKMYSSGMTSRLAFAVCAHVNADVLIVDEALSVGDASFAQKCLDYIRDFAKRGTILMVSHSPGTLEAFCDRVIWIEDGVIRDQGNPVDVLAAYREAIGSNGEEIELLPVDPRSLPDPELANVVV
jgi:homopolymeric O-antigen transport system ATP-binding protein